MVFPENQQHILDPAPSSFSAGNHEMRDDYATQATSRPLSHPDPYLTPYLGLRARLSQTWINRWTILLLLVLIRTLLAIASLDDNLATARRQALSSCTSVENVGSTMASMPHYMSRGINEMTADGIDNAVNGLMKMLVMSITVVEELVLFVINMLTSTYLCLITFAVSGSLHVAISVAEDVGNFLNSTVQSIGKDLSHVADDFQSAMNTFLKGANDVESFFSGKSSSPPTIDISSDIQKLNGLTLPSGYDQGLEKLNASVPNYDQVKNLTNTAIRYPFEQVKKLLNESLPTYSMNRSLFPVPDKEQLSFCSNNNGINDFFDNLVKVEQIARKVFIAVILISAVLVMVPVAYREIRGYRIMQDRAKLISTDSRDSMDSVYIVSRPYTASAGIWLSEKLSSVKNQILVRWTVAYATTIPALFVLSLAVAGLLACLCQYILLKAIEKEVPILENQVIDFSNEVVNRLNNASEQWAIGTNRLITDKNATINHDVFGWVETSTTAINDTLNVFINEMTQALNATFGGTILYDPVSEVFHCLVGLKVESIEKGLTWIHDHAHIDFPLMANDTFSLGTIGNAASSKSELTTDPSEDAANEILSAVFHVTNALAKAVRQEAIISFCVLLIWILIVLVGFGQALYLGLSKNTIDPLQSDLSDAGSLAEEKQNSKQAFQRVAMLNLQPRTDPPSSLFDDNTGSKYQGQSYTLTPAPLPQFKVNPATSPILNTGFNAHNEKFGQVGGHHIDAAIRRVTHARTSSHGDLAVTSPISPVNGNRSFLSTNPFQFPRSRRIDPFADPMH